VSFNYNTSISTRIRYGIRPDQITVLTSSISRNELRSIGGRVAQVGQGRVAVELKYDGDALIGKLMERSAVLRAGDWAVLERLEGGSYRESRAERAEQRPLRRQGAGARVDLPKLCVHGS